MFKFCENRILFFEVSESSGLEQQPPQFTGKEAMKLQKEKHEYVFENAKVDEIHGVIDKALGQVKNHPKTTIVLRGVAGRAPINADLDLELLSEVKKNLEDIFRLGVLKEVLGEEYGAFKNNCYTDGFVKALGYLDIAKRQAVLKYSVAYLGSSDLKKKLEKKFQDRLGITFEIGDPRLEQDKDIRVNVSVGLKFSNDNWWNELEKFEKVRDAKSAVKLIISEAERSDVLINEFVEKYGLQIVSPDDSSKVGSLIEAQDVIQVRRRVLFMMKNDLRYNASVSEANNDLDKDLAKIDEQMKRIDKCLEIFWKYHKV